MSALEQSMKDMIASRGCDFLAVQLYDYGGRLGFSTCLQWDDEQGFCGRGIAVGNGETISEAIAEMLANFAAKRSSAVIADEALPLGVAA